MGLYDKNDSRLKPPRALGYTATSMIDILGTAKIELYQVLEDFMLEK